ncbi:torsin-1A [Neocloeon triangulifer]|uniref:torsin-1A n=1 Tax=Neocloeon triangulifer TaxID=2078957 RepID=UPI00286F6656|nr:torsin-1A [Neocloeon triangulifer]
MKSIFLLCVIISLIPTNRAWWPSFPSIIGEWCYDWWIPANVTQFHSNFRQEVFGQPLVENIVAKAVFSHLREAQPKKALVLSFHGWPGVGKNFVASLLVNSVFSEGTKSNFYKYYNARINFPVASKVPQYQEQLRADVKSVISKCNRSIFVFDEIDMMPPKLIDAIHPYIDYHDNVNGVDPRHAIFIFLSNKGGRVIAETTYELWKANTPREKFNYLSFKESVQRAAFNEVGGLQHSDNINSFLVSFFVPFLPLQKQEVVECIKAELKRRLFFGNDENIIKEVLEHIVFTKPDSPSAGLFAVSGCKNIDSLVGTAIVSQRFYRDEL